MRIAWSRCLVNYALHNFIPLDIYIYINILISIYAYVYYNWSCCLIAVLFEGVYNCLIQLRCTVARSSKEVRAIRMNGDCVVRVEIQREMDGMGKQEAYGEWANSWWHVAWRGHPKTFSVNCSTTKQLVPYRVCDTRSDISIAWCVGNGCKDRRPGCSTPNL